MSSNAKNFVLLVPQDILTKEFTWISKNDFLENSSHVFSSIDNDELRTKLNHFFNDNLLIKLNKKKQPVLDTSPKSKRGALIKTIAEYPDVLDYYIKSKEKEAPTALTDHIISPERINFFMDTEKIQQEFSSQELKPLDSIDDCIKRMLFFKKVMESNSNDLQIKNIRLQEKQLQLMFKMVTFGSLFDYNSEVNNGRGPIDFIISMGSGDKTGLEFKLASNTKLKQNLKNQGDVYQKDSNLKLVIKVIFFFSDDELQRIQNILKELSKSVDNREIFLIDCRKKKSASNAV